MVLWKQRLLARMYRAPAGDDGDGGGAVDRGDDWVPTGDDAPESPDAKALRLEKEAATRKKDEEEAAAKGKADKSKAEGGEGGEDDPDGEGSDTDAGKDKDGKRKDTRIPLSRHKAMLEKERERREELERQIKSFQGAREVANTSKEISDLEEKIGKLDTDYAKAMADGETAKAAQIMREIRTLDRQVSDLNAQHKIAAAEARAVETTRYQIALERVEAAYPVLNEDHDDFDKEVYEEVVDLMGAYRAKGLTPTEALQKSVRMVFRGQEKTATQERATTVKPRVDETDVDKVKAERKKTAVEKALEAEGKSPGTATAKHGMNSNEAGAGRTAKDVIKMSQSEFAKLDEKELARLRGDEVEA